MSFLTRNGVRFPKLRALNPAEAVLLVILFAIIVTGVLFVIFPNSPSKSSTTPKASHQETTADNHYTVGQNVYCWDDNWFPCTIIGIEDNGKQYFISAPTDKDHPYFHLGPKDITASGTYKGDY